MIESEEDMMVGADANSVTICNRQCECGPLEAFAKQSSVLIIALCRHVRGDVSPRWPKAFFVDVDD